MADLERKREALATTRARLDAHLDELAVQVPTRDHLVGIATKVGAAAGGLLAGVAVVVIATKSRLKGRRDRSQGRKYAEALLAAMPEVAAAWQARADVQAEAPAIATVAAAPVSSTGGADLVSADGVGRRAHPRGGAPTAVLVGLGVIGGVAIQRLVNEG